MAAKKKVEIIPLEKTIPLSVLNSIFEIINHFDFDQMYIAVKSLKWYLDGLDSENIKDKSFAMSVFRATAFKRLVQIHLEQNGRTASGWYDCERIKDEEGEFFSISFVVTEMSNY